MQTKGKILCCLCGVHIDPNEVAMCVTCLKNQLQAEGNTDITQTQNEIIQCGKCNKWMLKQDQWVSHDLESTGLLGFCVKKIPGLQKNSSTIKDAVFVWTEPHSKRIKVAVDVNRSVMDGKISVQQKVIVEFIIKNKQCMDCIREATDHTWGGLIQIRQHVGHKKTFYQLETMLMESELYHLMINIHITKEGMDLYFKHKSQAEKVGEFISSRMPVRTKISKKLISSDQQSNTSKFEHTIYIEMVPLCKGDLLIIPKTIISGYQGLAIVTKLTSNVQIINPATLFTAEITPTKYFAKSFMPIGTSRQLIPFVILDIKLLEKPIANKANQTKLKVQNLQSNLSEISKVGDKYSSSGYAEAVVARESDLGVNDDTFITYTHLGHILQPGDVCLGYDLQHLVLHAQGENFVNSLHDRMPDVILVRKTYISRRFKNYQSEKKWKKENFTTLDEIERD